MAVTAKTPWHLWLVGVITLLWNAMSAMDYVMMQTGNQAYLEQAGMGPEELAYLNNFPIWADAAWAVGVWFSLAGSILLLLRNKLSPIAFMVSFVGLVVITIWQYAFPHPASFASGLAIGFAVVLWAVVLFSIWYSRLMHRRGVLR